MNFFKPNFWDNNKVPFFPILLFPISLIIKFLFFLKKQITKKHQFSIPIICVGNIYLGGTGKTPLCIEIFSILKKLNMNPAFIRKDYKAFKDESTLEKNVGPVYENKKRHEALKNAIQNKINIAILDDGFQDFSINKNLSILCFNEKQLIGNGFTIPSGPLRENLISLKRADCVMINGNKNENFEKKIISYNKNIKIFYSNYIAENISEFKNKKVIAFAGIGNPDNFFNLLEKNSIEILNKIKYPDHHNYSEKEIKKLINAAEEKKAILLTTEKDYFRINESSRKNIQYLKIKTNIENKSEFVNFINKII